MLAQQLPGAISPMSCPRRLTILVTVKFLSRLLIALNFEPSIATTAVMNNFSLRRKDY
jgi:hypothetical protein